MILGCSLFIKSYLRNTLTFVGHILRKGHDHACSTLIKQQFSGDQYQPIEEPTRGCFQKGQRQRHRYFQDRKQIPGWVVVQQLSLCKPNGKYLAGHNTQYGVGITYEASRDQHYSIKFTQFKVKPLIFTPNIFHQSQSGNMCLLLIINVVHPTENIFLLCKCNVSHTLFDITANTEYIFVKMKKCEKFINSVSSFFMSNIFKDCIFTQCIGEQLIYYASIIHSAINFYG